MSSVLSNVPCLRVPTVRKYVLEMENVSFEPHHESKRNKLHRKEVKIYLRVIEGTADGERNVIRGWTCVYRTGDPLHPNSSRGRRRLGKMLLQGNLSTVGHN